MKNRNIKFIVILLAFLMVLGSEYFLSSQTNFSLAILLFCIFLLFFIEIKKEEKINAGLAAVLEKSEENRINSEKIKNKILLIIDGLPEGILIIDKDSKVSIINSKAEKFLGVHRNKILNKPISDMQDLSDVKKIIFPLLANFKLAHKEEIEVRKNFILSLEIEPLAIDKNNTAKLIIMRDITKTKHSEDTKNQFFSIAAHQLKTPLSTTRLSVKMLLDENFGKIKKEQKDVLEKIYKNNESLIYLIQDLLNEAKVDEIDRLKNRSLFDLEALTASVIDFYSDELKEKKIDFKFKKSEKKLPKILAEEEEIKMVIQNLFDNAIKYTSVNGKIEAGITVQKDGLEFQIKDSGIGIPENQKEKIFKRFSRSDNAEKIKINSPLGSSGLGLAIAKDIIEKHAGKIWFQSKENEGSTFFFSLPFTKR